MLPKIHNPNNPGRPIVSACYCPTENIAAYLDEVMAPLVRCLPTYVKDSNDALRIFDTCHGSKMGPSYACLYAGYIEEQIRARYTGFVPQLLRRYIDDVVGCAQCSRRDLEQYIDYVSSFHPALQFTSTISELELPFPDIKLRINGDKLQTSVHHKETDTHNYLHYSSLHPDHCKRAIAYRQFLRLRRICSDDADFTNRATEMKEYFLARGYPDRLVNNDLRKVSTARTTLLASTPTSHNDSLSNKVPLVLRYNPFNAGTRRILLDNFNILSSDLEARRIFPKPPLV